MIRRLLRACRLDDLLALLFTGALLLFSTLFSAELDFTTLRGSLFLFVYYGLLFSFGRWLVRTPRVSPRQRHATLAWILVIIVTLILLIPGRDLMLLEKPKYILIAILPLLLAWWVTPAERKGDHRGGQHSSSVTYRIIRDFGPVLVSQLCYLLLHDVIHQVNPNDRDSWLIAADLKIFGVHLTQWLEPYVRWWLTEWFSATYSLFLIFPLSLALWFVARGERKGLLHLFQAIVLINYIGYIGYLLVPAIGPMYTLHYDVPLAGGWFFQVKEALDEMARVPRDNFPSLHTGVTFVVLLVVLKYARRLAWIYFPLGAGCIAATIYLRYHYTVDVIAGFLLGGAIFWVVPGLARAWQSLMWRWTGGESP